MRKLMLFSIGFAAACVLGVYLLQGHWLLLVASVCLVAAIPLLILKYRSGRITAMLLLGFCVGSLWNWGYDCLYLSDARAYDGTVVQTQIAVSDYCYETDYGVAADGRITLAGKSYRVRFYLNEDTQLKPGDRVTGSFRLRYTANGGEKEPTYHQGNGTFLLAYARSETQITSVDRIPARYFAATARQKILQLIDSLFPEDTLGFARALLLGDSSKLSYEVDSAFKISGIRHVIAVSGLHVTILFSVVYLFGGRHKVMGVVLGIPVLVLFAAIAGFTPSIVRACIMQGLMVLSLLVDKEYDPPTALGASALVMLLVNPLMITSVSFQLSVGCMIGIFLFSQPIRDYLLRDRGRKKKKQNKYIKKLTHGVVASFSVTVGAMITTTPLCAYYFGTVSLIGILTNLLTLWIISFIFYGIMLCCIAGAIWLPLGRFLAAVVSWAMRYVLWTADLLSSFPLAAVYTKSVYITAWLIFCYLLLAVFLLSKKKHPLIFTACLALALGMAVGASYLEPHLNGGKVSVLNVGQGQCIVVQSRGKTYLIDCGGDTPEMAADEAARSLLSQGITRLDGVVLTHFDEDHAAGVPLLLSRIPADTLYLPVTADADIVNLYDGTYGASVQWITQDTALADGGIHLSLYPMAQNRTDDESSLCILCRVENCDILITGDCASSEERRLLENHNLPDLEVLVVGHHGSKTATSLELLHATMPDVAVISVSATNSYGHPAQETLDRLELFGCRIFRTDKFGTVIIEG